MSKVNVEISVRPYRLCSQDDLRFRNDSRRGVAGSANLWVNSGFWRNSVHVVRWNKEVVWVKSSHSFRQESRFETRELYGGLLLTNRMQSNRALCCSSFDQIDHKLLILY